MKTEYPESAAKIFCPECGTPNSEVASFCTNCGLDLRTFGKKIQDIDLLQDYFKERKIFIDFKINDYKHGSHFFGRDETTGQSIVVKILNKEAAKDPTQKKLFENWSKIGSILSHPNILRVQSYGEIQGRNFLISAYAESGPLDQLLKSYGSSGMPVRMAISILIKVLHGLEAIHQAGYAIRDLKTGNILIQKNGEPAISGFHLAEKLGKLKLEGSKENSLVGSVAYMSPERCRLSNSIDRRSDIYSAGIIFFELLTGELPFTGEVHKIIFQHTNKLLPSINYRLIAKGLNSINQKDEKIFKYTGEIHKIIERACSKSKAGRYATALDFATELERFLQFVSIPEQPKEVRDEQWKVLRGYKADQSGGTGEDKLGITGNVEAFARLISSKSVHPPLSIGLFGNWGAGKSFFIKKLTQEINKLALKSKETIETGRDQRDLPFYSRIVQIEFNAWHFVDANLWPSLVHHIFSNLKIPGEKTSEIKERRNYLIQKIESEKEGLHDLEKEEHEFLEKANLTQEMIEKESNNYQKIVGNFFKEKIKAEIEEKLDDRILVEWARKAGIEIPANEKASEKVHQLYEESQKLKNPTTQELLKKKFKAYTWFVIFGFAIFCCILLGFMAMSLYNHFLKDDVDKMFENGFSFLKVAMTYLTTIGAGLLGLFKSFTGVTHKYLNWVPGFLEKLKQVVPDFEKELEKIESEKNQKLQELEAEKNSYLQKKEDAQTKLQELEKELSETTEGDLLKQFVQSRMGTDEYSKHLGIQAKIRDDFEKLSNLITNYNHSLDEGMQTKESELLFNRIVLYIDDLDRCPPEKVVEVLQAVHLLLSFPAFIVVVAVDSRWVSQSLRIGYKELFGDDIDSDGDGIPDFFRATPNDYLEKIFQIPFWLFPMNIEGRRNLISSLMEGSMVKLETEEEKPTPETPILLTENPIYTESESKEEIKQEDVEEKPNSHETRHDIENYQPHQEEINFTSQLVIQKNELDFSIIIAPILGQSPRALKRFVNVYLLIKVGLSNLQWQIYFEKIHPKTGQKDEREIVRNFQAVMFLLAITTGMPATSKLFFKALRNRNNRKLEDLLEKAGIKKLENGNWSIFGNTTDEITMLKKQVGTSAEISEEFKDRLEKNNFNMQIEILQFLKWMDANRSMKDWGQVDLDQLRYWDPIISKYSFRVEPFEQD